MNYLTKLNDIKECCKKILQKSELSYGDPIELKNFIEKSLKGCEEDKIRHVKSLFTNFVSVEITGLDLTRASLENGIENLEAYIDCIEREINS